VLDEENLVVNKSVKVWNVVCVIGQFGHRNSRIFDSVEHARHAIKSLFLRLLYGWMAV